MTPAEALGAVRVCETAADMGAKMSLYILIKADGTKSAPNTYDAISRLAGHFLGARIEKAQ